jgi:hypothetical protein
VDIPSSSAPTALADLIAAGLVSHEMIGDPDRLGSEAEALRVLCGLIAGPIWRIEPFHYAFRADPLAAGTEAAEARAAALEAALQAELGSDAAWVNATEPLPEDAAALLEQPLLMLRAQGGATAEALTAAGPELQAVINARVAVETARLAASVEPGAPLAARLVAIETRQAEILAALAARSGIDDTLARLTETLAVALQRLEAQSEVLHGHIAREDMVAGRLAELSQLALGPAAFQESLGLTLAEFLARLERRAEETAPSRVPQFS